MSFNWKDEYYRYHRYFFSFQKKTQNAKVHSFAWLSLTIFTISFFALIAIRPTLVTIARLNREIKDKKAASEILQKKINSIIAAQDEFARFVDFLPLLDDALPGNSAFPRLASYLEGSAASSGVTLKSLSFEKIGATQKVNQKISAKTQPLNFSLIATGEYFKLKSFLESLENSRRIIQPERAGFSRVKKEDGWELALQFSGQAVYTQEIKK